MNEGMRDTGFKNTLTNDELTLEVARRAAETDKVIKVLVVMESAFTGLQGRIKVLEIVVEAQLRVIADLIKRGTTGEPVAGSAPTAVLVPPPTGDSN